MSNTDTEPKTPMIENGKNDEHRKEIEEFLYASKISAAKIFARYL